MSKRDVAEFLALAAIWGASFLFMRVAAPAFGPMPLMLVRCAIGALTLLIVLVHQGKVRTLTARAGPLLAIGVINSAIPFVLLGYATLSLTAGVTSILNSLAPLFSALIAFAWLGDRLTRAQMLGLALGVIGVVVLMGGGTDLASGGLPGGVTPDGSRVATGLAERLFPFAVGILATLFYGLSANIARRHFTGVDPLATATGSQIGATAALLVPGVLLWPEATAASPAPDTGIWVAALALGVVCTGVAYLLFFRLIASVGATRTIAVTFVIPLFGVGWGALFLGERIDAMTLAGGAIIMLGTALVTGVLRGRRAVAVKA